MQHDVICNELENWSAEVGQNIVTIRITEELEKTSFLFGLMPICDKYGNVDERSLHNNRQQIFRWIRSDSKASRRKISELTPAIKNALPPERRARLAGDRHYWITLANKKCVEAINSVLLGGDSLKYITDAITALTQLSTI